jgi:hypothetical protein
VRDGVAVKIRRKAGTHGVGAQPSSALIGLTVHAA